MATDNKSAKYEIKTKDFYFRTEGPGGEVRLGCSPHIHYQIEFLILKEGTVNANIDSVSYKITAGDLCIVFPNQIHSFESIGEEKYDLAIASPDIIPEFDEIFSQRVPETAILKREFVSERMLQLMERMGELAKQDSEYSNVLLKGVLLSFFGEAFENLQLTDVHSVSSHALKTVVNYCARNFSRDLSLAILEEELHISKYYISHLFSMKLKVRFNDYINSLRISDACRQLKQTDKTITEISECVGFNTLRTFNRAFIRQVGMSPSEYRRSSQQNVRSVSMIV